MRTAAVVAKLGLSKKRAEQQPGAVGLGGLLEVATAHQLSKHTWELELACGGDVDAEARDGDVDERVWQHIQELLPRSDTLSGFRGVYKDTTAVTVVGKGAAAMGLQSPLDQELDDDHAGTADTRTGM